MKQTMSRLSQISVFALGGLALSFIYKNINPFIAGMFVALIMTLTYGLCEKGDPR